MRCVIWVAVSSKPQAEKDGYAEQLGDARALCEKEGWEIITELEVPGHTRSYWQYYEIAADVPAYAELQRLAEAHAFDVLICRELDRLGRSDSLLAQVQHLLRQNDIQIFELANPVPVVEPGKSLTTERLYLDAIRRAGAEDEVLRLRRRHTHGMHGRVKKGLPPSEPPYGYVTTGKTTPPTQIPEQVAVIRQMRELYLQGWGYDRIAGWLNQNGPRPLRAKHWRGEMVSKTLANPFHAGLIHYGNLTAPGQHEPVWTPAEWAELQTERRRRKQTRGKTAAPYNGLVRCQQCGRIMIYNSTTPHGKTTYRYYVCGEGARRGVEKRAGWHRTCVRLELIREAVLAEGDRLGNPAELEREIHIYATEEPALVQHRIEEIEAALADHQAEVRRLLDAYTRYQRIAPDTFEQAMDEAAQHQEELEAALADLLALRDELPDPERRASQLAELASDVEKWLDHPDLAEANAWLSRRIAGIWCQGREVIRVELK